MSYVSNRRRSNRRRRLSPRQAGTTSLEFALVAVPFFFLLIAATDLGRYFITRHSLRTLTSEAARSAVVNCFGPGACSFATAVPSPPDLWTKTPFLTYGQPGSSLTASQSVAPNGVRTITVTAQYPFTFILPVWTSIRVAETCPAAPSGQTCPIHTICQTTCLTY